ncbi:hypothetical protein [Priestia megaterium]|uniref:hypothetical protein n=1 Tax=Priestia megaterium TaxID=1404 RepID=UPI002FFF8E50
MSFNAEVLRVLIASPSDVTAERNEIEKAIFEWNSRYAEELQVVLLPGRWENDVVPAYGGIDPQQIINEQLVHKCDMVIGVFWTKLGTPTTQYSSGTLEEINIFIEENKEVMVYFLDKAIPRSGINYAELQRVDDYKAEYGKKGVYATYDQSKIMDHLYRKVMNHKKKNENLNPSDNDNTQPLPSKEVTKEIDETAIKQLILSNKLTRPEMLMLAYIINTETRHFGVRWKADETIDSIKQWEENELITGALSNNYDKAITNLADRELIEATEETSHGNVRLYSMPLNIYDHIWSLKDDDDIKAKLEKIVLDAVELPF